MKKASFYLIVPAAALVASSVVALADDATPSSQTPITDVRGQSVRDRARPGYDAVGIRAGSFMILPKVDVTETYNDNIYATDTNTESDFITAVSPSIRVQSLWSRHALGLQTGLSKYWYGSNATEDRLDWNVGANGRLDVLRDTNITGEVGYRQAHEDRGSANSPTSAAEPVEYNLFNSSLGLFQRFNRVTARLTGTLDQYSYKDVALIGGGMLDESARDRKEYGGGLRLAYDISPDTNVYAEGKLNKRSYDVSVPVDRNSNGYEAVIGSEFKLSRLAQGEIYAGYQRQTYDAAYYSATSGLAYGAKVNWFVTPLTTVRLSAASMIEESIDPAASGYLSQKVGVGIDHELLRNLILSGDVSYENDDFGDTSRQDDVTSVLFGASYLLNNFFAVGINYGIVDRNSNVSGADYQQNQVGFTLRGQL
ncbi:outer membrane beta-barrel protein [Parvibaculum sp.]|uniref:outer membrane beta-barrel protein n=1 Tax=Parvibaculum sp. TaxID=2024848 RepID=UPI00320E2658